MYNQRLRYMPMGYGKISVPQQDVAISVIDNPQAHLLSHEELKAARGGTPGFALEFIGGFGTLLFATRFHMTTLKSLAYGQFRLRPFVFLLSAMLVNSRIMRRAGVRFFGDKDKLFAHNQAYTFVKTNNRFEGRRTLAKAPFMY